MAETNPAKPFYSVLVLAFVCSALVAGAAVGLRPLQEANQILDRKKHILYAANLFDEAKTIDEMFEPVETKIVELTTGKYVTEDVMSPQTYNQKKAALSENMSSPLLGENDKARIRRVENYSLIYLVQKDGKTDQIVLPVRGKGLWSTMYAYVALDGDLKTIRGVSFYEHGETPGLGGEIENKRWQKNWEGKKVYKDSMEFGLGFAKGKAATDTPAAPYQIDGLSGATLTTKGVDSLMEFWFGEHGFKPYLSRMINKDNNNG
jgi:Na+-transporting NADH:ubiquinone oxidoreductase subunit C